MMERKKTGKLGEELAAKYLRGKGYRILERNFPLRISGLLKAEIDLIVRKDDIIHFVEVKTLKDDRDFLPEEKVDFKKRRRLIISAEAWLKKKKLSLEVDWQIDVISVKLNFQTRRAKICHFENVVGR